MVEVIVISGIHEATDPDFVREREFTHRLSLVGAYDVPLLEATKYMNLIETIFVFDDVTRQYEKRDDKNSMITVPTAPLKEDVENILNYFKGLIDSGLPIRLLINCHAGISRSTAAGLMLLKLIHQDNRIAKEKLQEIRPIAYPNGLMIRLADEIMGWDLENHMQGCLRWDSFTPGGVRESQLKVKK